MFILSKNKLFLLIVLIHTNSKNGLRGVSYFKNKSIIKNGWSGILHCIYDEVIQITSESKYQDALWEVLYDLDEDYDNIAKFLIDDEVFMVMIELEGDDLDEFKNHG